MDGYLAYREEYERGYAKGYRIGKISTSRKILIWAIKIKAKSSGKPKSACNKLFKKINFECDCAFLYKIFFYLLDDKISIDELEITYDTHFRTEEEIRDEKYTIYNKL
jgi:hypothetical protein